MTRYIIEGEWTGYTSSQRRVCHREVYKTSRTITKSPFLEAIRRIGAILFTDNTSLILHIREAKPREKVQEIHGYTKLIRKAVQTGQRSVAEMSND
jgi:hypothetical protein